MSYIHFRLSIKTHIPRSTEKCFIYFRSHSKLCRCQRG